jgi:hypothetical protein
MNPVLSVAIALVWLGAICWLAIAVFDFADRDPRALKILIPIVALVFYAGLRLMAQVGMALP